MDFSEPRLKVQGAHEQHERPYSKRVCCLLWTEIRVTVRALFPLQPEDLKQLSIVYFRAKLYIRFMYRECSYYSQMSIHDVSRLQKGLLSKVRQTCTLPVPFSSVMKQSFHVKGCSIRTTPACGPQKTHSATDHEPHDNASLLMCGRYCQNGLPMSRHLFDAACEFSGTGHHLIMEGVYVIICTRHFQNGGLDVVVPSLGLPDPLIYLFWGVMNSPVNT
ncbi:hypothetical protein TNCV_3027601 [Trichonephila clavipes]|nr:hypothetical protein TNCV_3027601 [Trichonephila clavipes]